MPITSASLNCVNVVLWELATSLISQAFLCFILRQVCFYLIEAYISGAKELLTDWLHPSKPLVILASSYTWPPFRGQVGEQFSRWTDDLRSHKYGRWPNDLARKSTSWPFTFSKLTPLTLGPSAVISNLNKHILSKKEWCLVMPSSLAKNTSFPWELMHLQMPSIRFLLLGLYAFMSLALMEYVNWYYLNGVGAGAGVGVGLALGWNWGRVVGVGVGVGVGEQKVRRWLIV